MTNLPGPHFTFRAPTGNARPSQWSSGGEATGQPPMTYFVGRPVLRSEAVVRRLHEIASTRRAAGRIAIISALSERTGEDLLVLPLIHRRSLEHLPDGRRVAHGIASHIRARHNHRDLPVRFSAPIIGSGSNPAVATARLRIIPSAASARFLSEQQTAATLLPPQAIPTRVGGRLNLRIAEIPVNLRPETLAIQDVMTEADIFARASLLGIPEVFAIPTKTPR